VISRRNFFKASGLLTATAILNNIKLPVAAGGSGREGSLLIDTEKFFVDRYGKMYRLSDMCFSLQAAERSPGGEKQVLQNWGG